MIYFTSDLHLGHANIIKYCNRPFSSVEEMDSCILNNINNTVKFTDTLYIIGDFSFRNSKSIDSYRNRITCRNVHLIKGNHDPKNISEPSPYFISVKDLCTVKFNKQKIILCHYAMRTWDSSHHGSWHLWGHSHYTLKDDINSLSIDVGIDAVAGRKTGYTFEELEKQNIFNLLSPENYAPLSFEDIFLIMKTKTPVLLKRD